MKNNNENDKFFLIVILFLLLAMLVYIVVMSLFTSLTYIDNEMLLNEKIQDLEKELNKTSQYSCNTTIIENKEYIIDTCNYQVLEKEYEMYKQQIEQEYNLINACKEGMLK